MDYVVELFVLFGLMLVVWLGLDLIKLEEGYGL